MFILAVVLSHLSASPQAAEVAGHAVSVTGKVLSRNTSDSDPSMKFLKSGDPIAKGTIINTSNESSVKLMMSDKSIIDVGPSASFHVDEYKLNGGSDRNVQLSMEYGKVRASINQPVAAQGKFNIKTHSATMGVRGTEFIIETSAGPATQAGSQGTPTAASTTDAKLQVTVVHGEVAVLGTDGRSKELTRLSAGNQLTTTASQISSGKSLQVATLAPAQLQAAKADAKQADHTFTQAVVVSPSTSQSSGGNNQPGGPPQNNNNTLAAMSHAIAATIAAAPPPLGPVGAVGTFNFQDLVHSTATNAAVQNGNVSVTVVFSR